MVKAGEEGGNLSSSLFAVSDQLDRAYSLQRKMKGALIYPAIVISVMLLVGATMFVYVIPKLTSAFKEFSVELPLSTKIVIAVSDFMQARLLLGISIIVVVFGGLWVSARQPFGKRFIDFTVLRLPAIRSIIREANAARVAQTLSSLLSSGVEVVLALKITADVLPNTYYRNVLIEAGKAVEKGEPMSGVFRAHENILPPFLSEMVAVGEETGRLSGMLKETGVFFEAEVEQKIKNISTIIEPALMIFVGIAVGFFAVAMISPAYSLMDSI
jgi:type IV pilus assembly protein PilC